MIEICFSIEIGGAESRQSGIGIVRVGSGVGESDIDRAGGRSERDVGANKIADSGIGGIRDIVGGGDGVGGGFEERGKGMKDRKAKRRLGRNIFSSVILS